MAKAEGMKFDFLDETHIETGYLEVFDTRSDTEKSQLIRTENEEFSAVCPFSGLPDLAILSILYFPRGGKIVELKSLKYYMTSFRSVGIYQEAATARIFDDLSEALNLKSGDLQVQTKYKARGGFVTTSTIGHVLDEVNKQVYNANKAQLARSNSKIVA